jgi:hypothetical protein
MRNGFAFSIGVHALILLLLLFGLPFMRVKPPEEPPMVSVELVQESKQTTTNKVSPVNKVEKQPQEETPPPPPKPQTAPEPTPLPEPPKLETVDTSTPEALQPPPEQKLDKPLPAPPKIADVSETAPRLTVPQANIKPHLTPAPTLTEVDTQVAALVPPAKVDLKRPQPKTPPKSFDAVLKNLTKNPPQETEPDTPPQPTRTTPHRASGAQAPVSANLTSAEMDALRQQLGRCWNLPASAKNAQDLVIDLDVTVNADRTVASAAIVDESRMSDPIYAAAARSALRAVRSPECTPLELPPEKYREWQSMSIRFDPKEMLGQ